MDKLRYEQPQKSLVLDYNARRWQICSKLLTRNPVPLVPERNTAPSWRR
jgi:hypothetical protein